MALVRVQGPKRMGLAIVVTGGGGRALKVSILTLGFCGTDQQ